MIKRAEIYAVRRERFSLLSSILSHIYVSRFDGNADKESIFNILRENQTYLLSLLSFITILFRF